MNKAVSILKKALKVLFWVMGGYVLLLVVATVLIQIPAIQLKATRYATSFVSNKTHTIVAIKNIRISFPKSVVVEGLYLEDTQKDTLLYAREIQVNLAFRDLFRRKIHLRSFALEGVVLNVHRAENDSLFNYNFLLTAFRDTTPQNIAVPASAPWTFNVANVRINNFRLSYRDEYAATNLKDISIPSIEMDFSMDAHSINAQKLKLQVLNSSLEADLSLKFASMADSIQSMSMRADLKKVSLRNADILRFNPRLAQYDFFKDTGNTTTISGVLEGTLNKINGTNLVILTGVSTRINTDFSIAGLPDVPAASFHFPNLNISTGRKDLTLMAGSFLPKGVEVPEQLSMQIVFNGQIKSFETTVNLSSSYGQARLTATLRAAEQFTSNISLTRFDLGRLLKNRDMFGPVSLTAQINGRGLEAKTLRATLRAQASQLYLNHYTYQNLKVDGTISAQEFEGKINLNDPNVALELEGLVNITPRHEHGTFRLNLQRANLQKLRFSEEDIRIGFIAEAAFKGATLSTLSGRAGLTHILVTHLGKEYPLDSLSLNVLNEPGKSELTVNSPLSDIHYLGTSFPSSLPVALNAFANHYFPFSSPNLPTSATDSLHFAFEIHLFPHPLIQGLLLPELKEFEPAMIQGSFDSDLKELKINLSVKRLVYGTTVVNDLLAEAHSDEHALTYTVSSGLISTPQIKLDRALVEGIIADQAVSANVSLLDSVQNKNLIVRSRITKHEDNYRIAVDPSAFFLMNDRWNIVGDNYIEVGNQGFMIHHFFMNKAGSQINIASANNQFNDDLNIEFKNFQLGDIARIIEKDTSLLKGTLGGNVLLKRVNNTYGIIADIALDRLVFRQIPIGNVTVKAQNPVADRFNIEAQLSGAGNNLTASGYYIPGGGQQSVYIKSAIQSLSMKTVEAFSLGQISEASGTLSGTILVEGNTTGPDITGELVFNNAFITPAFLNSRLELKNEKVQLKKEGIYFNAFTLLDANQHAATISGSVQMEQFRNFTLDLQLNSKDFLLFNTTVKDNKEFYGRMIMDAKATIKGPWTHPEVNATFKVKNGSNVTFAVPEDKLTTDKGEDVVQFENASSPDSIRDIAAGKATQKSGFTGFVLSSIIEIDKQATLRLLMDPASTDSLVVRGDAALSFDMDRSGKMSLTGAYNLSEGSYLVSLESVLKRKFTIEPGSTIIWNGDPLEAEISINAIYSVRASPYDLVADQMTSQNETDRNAYKQRYPFLVLLKLRGQILRPEISFEIQLSPEDKGIMGGAVNAKLNMLNNDPSSLNKQVFALLVLGRFIQENPFQTESSGVSTAARATVGKILSAQLNQLSSKIVPGVELNFDIQSYDDYQSGQAQGRTQVDIGAKKQMFNERLSVQLGGTVDVEGEQAKQNSLSDITSDITVEYKLTKDGRFRLTGFRHNQYEGAIDGQLVETGAGVLYLRDFNKWKELFKSSKSNNRDTIRIK